MRRRRVAIVIELGYALRHHHGVFAGIQQFAREHARWETIVQPRLRLRDSRRGREAYDGIIARASAELAHDAAAAGVPLVNVWSGTPVPSLPSVFPDFAAVGTGAADHLLRRGFRRFAYHGVRGHQSSEAVQRAFSETVRRANCNITSFVASSRCADSDRAWESYQQRMQSWIARWQPPVAALVIHDTYCRFLAEACLHARLRIPEDVALIGFGNELLVCSEPAPSLSSFDADHERVGYEAAVLLERLMNGAAPPPAPVVVAPKELVLRHSTDIYVVDDPLVSEALRFITERSHEGIRASDVAAQVGVSLRSLQQHFQAAMGRTMNEEISRLRIERAKRLLVESDAQIKEVARECGFNSAKHFHRMFRLAEGISASDYRASHDRRRPP